MNILWGQDFSPDPIPEPLSDSDKFSSELCRNANIKTVINHMNSPDFNHYLGFKSACANGRLELVELLYDDCKGNVRVIRDGFRKACGGGHLDIVRFLMNDCIFYWEDGLRIASSDDNIEMVSLFMSQPNVQLEEALYYACQGNCNNVAKLLIHGGARNLEEALEIAQCRQNEELILIIQSKINELVAQ